MQPIRVLIIHDSELFRTGIKHALNNNFSKAHHFELFQADTIRMASRTANYLQPDVLIVGVNLTVSQNKNWVEALRSEFADTSIIAFTKEVSVSIQEGNCNIIPESCSTQIFCSIVRNMIAINGHNESTPKNEAIDSNKTIAASPKITKREKEILNLVINNWSSREISQKLFLSKRTVEKHRCNILKKIKIFHWQTSQAKTPKSFEL